jgi:UDP-N-acetylglucosamine--N-acetylmuramyl-(pentapeptide) pyrophosphoryl-undecaprenol N-acetylglucosamine transferase
MKRRSQNIVICGGHLSPALALIEILEKRKKYEIFFLGRKNSFEGDNSLSLEYQTITRLGITFIPIISGRLQREFTVHTFLSLLKVPVGLIQSMIFLTKIKPCAVISFGGYVALPVCIIASLMQIPIIAHEQTHVMGMSNRIISKLSRIVCLSFEGTKYLPKGIKTVITGNPVRKNIGVNGKNGLLTRFGNQNKPLLFITGGSTGSKSINTVIGKIIPDLLNKYRVIHQCGSAENFSDFQNLKTIKNNLPKDLINDYEVYTHINPMDMGKILHDSTLVISRAGANTVTEISLTKKPSILIPLPWAADDEQTKNAQILKDLGSALVIYQKDLTPALLFEKVDYMVKNIHIYKFACKKASKLFENNAAGIMADIIDKTIRSNNEL